MNQDEQYQPASDSAPLPLEPQRLLEFRQWVARDLKAQLPHRALLCGQFVRRAGGYVVMQRHAFGLPEDYLQSITVADHNIHSPVLGRMMRSGQPQFFSIGSLDWEMDSRWEVSFEAAGWCNVVALGWRVAENEDAVVATVAGFYDVAESCGAVRHALQEAVMPEVHARLQTLGAHSPRKAALHLTPAEQQIARLLVGGRTNKEIARLLGRSDQTVKEHLARMMVKAAVANRTALTARLVREGL